MKRICVIINPYSQGGRTSLKSMYYMNKLKENGLDYDVYPTNERRHATFLVEELIDDYDLFLSVGGDGLIHEIIQVLACKKNKTLAVVPAGNGNMFARHHKISSFEKIIKAIKNNKTISIDLIKLSYKTKKNKEKTVFSHCIFGVGYIERVVSHATNTFNKFGPYFCYPISAFLSTLKVDLFQADIKIDNKKITIPRTSTIIFLNHGKVGPFNLSEKVSDTDGLLDYVIYHDNKTIETILCVLDTILGFYRFDKHRKAGKTVLFELKMSKPLNFMIDGEIYEKITSLKAEVVPNALQTYSLKKTERKD